MAIDTTALNKLITHFRALSQKDSVSPESLGSLLQKLADLLASCPADSEVNNALNSVNRNITSLQSDLQNIARSAVTADELRKALTGKADDFAYYVDSDTIEFRSGTLKVASQQIAMAIADIVNGNKLRDKNIEAKADTAELHVVLASMGVTLDNLDSTGDSAIMYVPNVGDIYYSEGKEHLFYKKSETQTIDLGVPSSEKIYANAMTKRLYIWRGGTWWQCGGGGAQIDAYTKAESDARYYEKSATDTLLAYKVSKTDIVQSTGTSEVAVMSQKSVTEAVSDAKMNLLYELGFSDLRHFYASRVDADTATYYVDDGIPDWVRTCPMIKNRYALNIDRFFSDNNVDIEKKKYTKQIKATYVWIEIIDNNSFVAYTSYLGTAIVKIEEASTVGEFAFCEIAKGFRLDITGFSTLIFEIDNSLKNSISSRYGLNGQVYADLLVYRERENKYYTTYNNVNNSRGYVSQPYIASSSYSNIIRIKRGNGKLEIEQAKINSSSLEIASTVNAVYENSVPLINPIVSDIQDEEKLYLSPLVYSYSSPLPYTPHTTIKVYGKK